MNTANERLAAEAADQRKLQRALSNPSPAMRHFSAEGLYALVGEPGIDAKIQEAIGAAFDKDAEVSA